MKNKKMGYWTVLALTLTATIGSSLLITFSGVFLSVKQNPLLMILAWIIGGIIILPETFLMVEPSISFQENGTTYSWLRRANWKVLGFWFGWVLTLFVSATAIAGSCIALSGLVMGFLKNDNVYLLKFVAIMFLLVIGGTQIFVKNSSQISQIVFLVIKALPILFVLILALIYGTNDKLLSSESMKENLKGAYISSALLIPAITITMFSFSGTEVPTYVTAEIKEAEKTTPKVILSGVIIVIAIYLIYGIALLSLASSKDEMGNTIGGLWGFSKLPEWTKITFNVMAILLFIGSINSFLLYQTRLVEKMAQEKDLSKHFLKKSKWSSQPYMSMLVLIVAASLYIMFNQIMELLNYFALAVSALKILMTTNVIYLRKTDSKYKRVYKNWAFWLFVVFSYLTCLLTLVGAIMNMLLGLETNQIWKPIVVILLVISILPIGYLKYYIQNKNNVKNNNLD
ncbi:amino acid permease [Spiroplasma diminutum]|uniref:Amino acid permease n=1 Tax=Spiroplasma diminutum CUAS-1 TaxID=1276221 RepID=S5M083_9MOLU|nr:amino acid permease [Spiroplasma diminutum]AGR42256.1 amino acid permease [Spiroplasma diminutum CUAS-1]